MVSKAQSTIVIGSDIKTNFFQFLDFGDIYISKQNQFYNIE